MGAKKYNRPVSVIGVGCTDFMTTPELTYHELFTWACQAAMEDAGIKPKDIDAAMIGQGVPQHLGNSLGTQAFLTDWIGMSGKPAYHQEEGCASGYMSFDAACQAVASGIYDIVLVADVELWPFFPDSKTPACFLKPQSEFPNEDIGTMLLDPAYERWNGASNSIVMDQPPRYYVKNHGISDKTMDDILNSIAIAERRGAHLNPHAARRELYEDIAKKAGFDNAMDYLRSPSNIFVTKYLRASSICARANAAGAAIVCSADIAKSFKQKPISVLGVGLSTWSTAHTDFLIRQGRDAINIAYENSGIRPEELKYVQTCDMNLGEVPEAVDAIGYLPGEKSWEYYLDGRTAFDGDKPINSDGGYNSRGHSFGASGMGSLHEVILQMRGQAGERQAKHEVDTALLFGFGGNNNSIATIFRVQE